MPDMGVKKPSWTSILVEPSGDSIPNYHSNASTEDPKGELPGWAQSTHSLWEISYLKPLKFWGKLLCSNNGKILFPRALELERDFHYLKIGGWWQHLKGRPQTPDEVMISQVTLLPLLLRPSCPALPYMPSIFPVFHSWPQVTIFKYILVVYFR